MRRGGAWWTATALSALALALVAGEAGLILWNGSTAARLATRRAMIEQTPQLARVTQFVASAIAGPGQSDASLKELLTRNGVAITPSAPPSPPSPKPN